VGKDYFPVFPPLKEPDTSAFFEIYSWNYKHLLLKNRVLRSKFKIFSITILIEWNGCKFGCLNRRRW
jgi:hypothetical protein